jgi:hypothetical protein
MIEKILPTLILAVFAYANMGVLIYVEAAAPTPTPTATVTPTPTATLTPTPTATATPTPAGFCAGSSAPFCLDFEEAFVSTPCNAEGADTVTGVNQSCDRNSDDAPAPLDGVESYWADSTGNESVFSRWNTVLDPVEATDTMTIKFLLNIVSAGNLDHQDRRLFVIYEGSTSSITSQVNILDADGDGNWVMRLYGQDFDTQMIPSGDDLATGTTYCVQYTHDLAGDDLELWINEATGSGVSDCGTDPSIGTDTDGTSTIMDADGLELGSINTRTKEIVIDDVEISWEAP